MLLAFLDGDYSATTHVLLSYRSDMRLKSFCQSEYIMLNMSTAAFLHGHSWWPRPLYYLNGVPAVPL